ncbi:hypothetical protein [Roseibium sp.]|uniref:hypothetical protein n=1 Tax=Roseibium sp. TaxID=1936156 RepID=UPI003A977B3B
MKKLAMTVTAIAFFSSSSAYAGLIPITLGTDDVDVGVLCKVKDVTVLAQSAEDCTKIGGAATHSVTTVKAPVK